MATIDPMAQLFSPDLMAQYRALLEPPQEAKRAAGMDALLALGLGLLANRSPYLGVAVGNAGVGAMGAYKSGMDTARANRMGEIQGAMGLRKLQQEMEAEQRLNELINELPPEQRPYAKAAPKEFIGARVGTMFPKAEPYTLGKGQRRYDASGNVVAEVPDTGDTTKISQLWAEYEATPVGHPKRQILMDAIRKESSHAPPQAVVSFSAPQFFQDPQTGQFYGVQGSNRGGLDVSPVPPNLRPTPQGGADKLPAEIGRMTIAMDSLQTGLTEYEQALKDFNPQNPADQANPEKRARIASLLADLRMQAKEAQALGALTGPDVEILDKALTDPTSFKGMYYGIKGATSQIDESRKALKRRREALLKNYPVAGKAQGAAGSAPQPQRSITVDW